MLGVHWLSDVVAGVAFGWAWFSVCAIAFGGRFLHFGAPVERAAEVAEAVPDDRTPDRPREAPRLDVVPPGARRRDSDVVEVALQRPEDAPPPARDSR